MRQLVEDVRRCVENEIWRGALFLSLALPDICGALEQPDGEVGKRYRSWYDRYLAEQYGRILTAEDCYYLRCSCLHQAAERHPKASYDGVIFAAPRPNWVVHLNRLNNKVQLQVDIFACDMCAAVDRWLADVADNLDVQDRLGTLLKVHEVGTF
jgi:hypothetical protein